MLPFPNAAHINPDVETLCREGFRINLKSRVRAVSNLLLNRRSRACNREYRQSDG